MDEMIGKLDAVFRPRTVALIGASDASNKLGFDVLRSLLNDKFTGKIIPINPTKSEILGVRVYPSLRSVPDEIDLGVIIIPPASVASVVRECAEKGVKAIVIITGGFREIENKRGSEVQSEIKAIADEAGIPIIGPNTFGVLNTAIGLNATFSPDLSQVKSGHIGLVTQSGGMAHIIIYESIRTNVGFGKIMGLGNRCNTDFAEAVHYLMEDEETTVIAVYLEGMDDPRGLFQQAKKFLGRKPIVIYKTGQTDRSDLVAASHTGSLAGKHEIYLGSFQQAGLLPVCNLEELIDAVKALDTLPLPKDRKVAIVSGQGGPAMTTLDVCERKGLAVSPFCEKTQRAIDCILPPVTMRTNPLDLGPFWNDIHVLKSVLQILLEDDDIAAILIIIVYGPANRHFVDGLAELLKQWRSLKPLVSCFSYPGEIWDGRISELESSKALVNYPTPERAAAALAHLWRYSRTRILRNPDGCNSTGSRSAL